MIIGSRDAGGDRTRVPILLYDPPDCDAENAFWCDVAGRLRAAGFELYLIADRASGPGGVSFIPLSWGLDQLGTHQADSPGGTAWSLDIGNVLQRETDFVGPATDPVLRRNAVDMMVLLQTQILSTFRPAMVIFWNGQYAKHLLVRSLLAPCNCPVIYAERAPLPGFVYLDPRGLMCEASFAQSQVVWPDDGGKETAIRRFREYERELLESGRTWWEQPRGEGERASRKSYGIPEEHKVVLFPEQIDNDTQSILFSPLFTGSMQALEGLLRMLDPHAGLTVIVKPHPKSGRLATDFDLFSDGRIRHVGSLSVKDALRMADYVAGVNSSVLFEAMCYRVPVLAMGRTLLEGRGIFYELRTRDDAETIAAWLGRRDWEARSRHWVETGAWFEQNCFFPLTGTGDDAASRNAALVARLKAMADASRADYSTLLPLALRSFGLSRRYAALSREHEIVRGRLFSILDHPFVRPFRAMRRMFRKLIE